MATIAEALTLGRQRQQAGDPQQAESIYRQILQVDPANVEALFLLGLVCRQLQKFQEAALRFEQALLLVPNQPEIHNALGLVQVDLGQPQEALVSFQHAIQLQPNFLPAHRNRAGLLQAHGRLVEAEACYRDALALAPNQAESHFALGCALQGQGKMEAAAVCYRQAVHLEANHAMAWNNLGDVLNKQGRVDEALGCFQRALQLEPNRAEAHYNLGSISQRLGKLQEAVNCYERAIRLNAAFAPAYSNLGMILAEDGQRDKAMGFFREALRINPNFADAHNNLATLLLEEGEQEEAVKHFHEAIRFNPHCIPALSTLAIHNLGNLTAGDVERMKLMMTTLKLPLADASQLHFALGNIRNRAGADDEAFAYFLKGNALRRQLFHQEGGAFFPENNRAWVDDMIRVCTPEFFQRVRGFGLDIDVPIFVVGMPRSGTSLVEQILSSHPQVFGCGELTDIADLADSLPGRQGSSDNFQTCLARIDQETTRAIANTYLAKVQQLAGRPVARVTDKMPGNCMQLGFIATLFPKAKILHTSRHPLDTCVSCFFQYFRGLPYTWDLEDLGHFYTQYLRLMEHWRAVLPLPILEVRHEELVDDPEGVSRRMVEFCGLQWDPRCLAFHENTRAVRTVSLVQVRKPIFKSGVGRWRRYEKHLGPLIKILAGDKGVESLG